MGRTYTEQKEFEKIIDLTLLIASPFLFLFGNCVIANSALSIQLIEKEKKEKKELKELKEEPQLEFRHVLSGMTIIVGIIIDFLAILYFVRYFVNKAADAAKRKQMAEMLANGY